MNGRSHSSEPVPLPANVLIRHARSRAGRTQREVAHRAGVRESAVILYELGRRIPSWDHLQRIVMACGFWLDVRLRELVPSRATELARDEQGEPQQSANPGPSTVAGIDRDSAVYLGHRLRLVQEELATMASCLEVVAESFKHAEARHYERFSRLVVVLFAPSLDQALASLERELRMVRSSRRWRRGGRPLHTLWVDAHTCIRLAERITDARRRLALAATRLRAEQLDDMAYAVEQQDRKLADIEHALRVRQEDVNATG